MDLDHCRNPETGEISEWAWAIIRTLDTYAEASPSGCGVRLFLRGDLPAHGRKRGDYENYQTGRYVTVTGQHIDGTPTTINHRQAELLRVHLEQFGDGKPRPAEVSKADWKSPTLDNASDPTAQPTPRTATSFLVYGGAKSPATNASEADLALVIISRSG